MYAGVNSFSYKHLGIEDLQVAVLRHRKFPEVLDLPNVSSAKWMRRGLKLKLAATAEEKPKL